MGVILGRIVAGINPQGWFGGILSIALAILLAVQVGHTHHWQHQSAHFEQSWTNEKLAHQQTILNYKGAVEIARRTDLANKQRAETEQRANVERTKADYEERIARARSDAQRLRDQLASAAHPGSSGSSPVSGGRTPGAGAVAAPPQDGFSIGDRLTATEQAIQLDALIDYVDGLLKVDMNGDAGRKPPAR